MGPATSGIPADPKGLALATLGKSAECVARTFPGSSEERQTWTLHQNQAYIRRCRRFLRGELYGRNFHFGIREYHGRHGKRNEPGKSPALRLGFFTFVDYMRGSVA